MNDTLLANRGGIEVICGSMFSGKTEELLRRIRRAQYAKLEVVVFKPSLENRYHDTKVVSHNQSTVDASPVEIVSEILNLAKNADVVCIDEAQFFDNELVDISQQLANQGKRVVVSGLDMDYTGAAFGCIPQLMAIAEYVTKLHAICVDCGALANYTYRTSKGQDLVELGASQNYCALCRSCFNHRNSK